MKILLISEFFPTGKELKFSGGVEARNLYLAKHLSRNHKVTVLTSKIKGEKSEENFLGCRILRVGPQRSYLATTGGILSRLQFIKSAIKTGQKLEFDIVDGSNFVTHFIARSIAGKNKTPIVAWYPDVWIGSWIKNAGILGLSGEILERINLFRGFDSCIAISKATASKLNKYVSQPIRVIPCGVEFTEFQTKIRKSKIPTIITISRLAKYKNIDKLILAFALIALKHKNIKMTIVGTGPEEQYLRELAHQLKTSEKIKFISNLSRRNLISAITSSHIFCLPSSVEGFGIATVEAASAGLPYVVSDIEVFKEVTMKGQGGFLFKTGNIKDLSSKLDKLLTDKSLYNLKAKQAKLLAKNYNWQEVADKTESFYKETINKYHE